MLPHRLCCLRRTCAWLVFAAAGAVTSPAAAFEHVWQLGAGLGGTDFVNTYDLGPSVGVYGSYGLSDMFDVRLAWTGSRHSWADGGHVVRSSVLGGVIYKVDVGDWIPYFGAALGYSMLLGDPAPGQRAFVEVAVPLGLEYVISRSAALGLEVSSSLLLGRDENGTGSLLVRAARRWDF